MSLFIRDPKLNVKSVTVTFVCISFLLCVVSLCLSHKFLSCLPATGLSILLFALCMLFYRLRKVDEFSLNVKTGEISAKDTEDQKS
jgi:hypothetical protein